MAAVLQQASLRHAVPSATSWKPQSGLSQRPTASLSSTSALSQPWWRHLALALPQCSAAAAVPRRSLAARASEGEAVEAEGDAEAEVAAPSEEAAPSKPVVQVKEIMNILNASAAKTLFAERGLPTLWPGDVVAMKVEVPENKRRVSLVRGIVIAKHSAGINSTFRIRRIMAGVGVEMVFPLFSPNIKEIKVVGKRRARRAKLYYLRDKIARLSTVN